MADDLRADRDLPEGIRYDEDLAVHEPMRTTEAVETPSRRASPLIMFPVGLLALAIGVYVLFGLIASEGKRSSDYLDEIRAGRSDAWKPAFELSRMLPSEPPRRREARFLPDLLLAFESARGADPRVRRYLAVSLGTLGDARAVDALLGALFDADVETRLEAARALGAIGDRTAAAGLAALLQDDEPDLRKTAAWAYGRCAGPAGASSLEPLLHDPIEDVAWNAALGLARLGSGAGLPLISRMLDRDYLDGVLRPDDTGTPRPMTAAQKDEAMINALRSIALLRDRGRRPILESLRDSDPSLRVRQAAFEALAAIESAGAGTPPSRAPEGPDVQY